MFDPEAQPDLPLPERVPDELVERYGARARRTVRGSRTWRRPIALRYHRARRVLKDRDLWVLTLLVFTWSVVAGPMPRSPDLIRAALRAGRIDYPTSLLYRLFALFDAALHFYTTPASSFHCRPCATSSAAATAL